MYDYYGYSSRNSFDSLLALGWIWIVALILGLVAAILVSCLLLPKKRYSTLPPFWKSMADFFEFKYLIIENILKFMHVWDFVFLLLLGLFVMFSGTFGGASFLIGFLIMLLGPIIARILYEFTMMTVLLIKNVSEINNKMKDNGNGSNNPFAMPAIPRRNTYAPAQPQNINNMQSQQGYNPQPGFNPNPGFTPQQPQNPESFKYCSQCGTKYNSQADACPQCGAPNRKKM